MKETLKTATFIDGNFCLDVKIDSKNNTVWLTQGEIALLYEKAPSGITKHINNIYNTQEQTKEATCEKNSRVQIENNRKVKRIINYYNRDILPPLKQRNCFEVGASYSRNLLNQREAFCSENGPLIYLQTT